MNIPRWRFGAYAVFAAAMIAGAGVSSQGQNNNQQGNNEPQGQNNDRDDQDETPRFTFALWGDMPYADIQKNTQIPRLIDDINHAGVAFTVFDGDIKSGSSVCTDNVFQEAIDRFNTFRRPMVYVPGDNEWTDCHRNNNGNYNSLERLAFLRGKMFATSDSFGEKTMKLGHQGPLGGLYAENTRWRFGNVYFLGLNVPGSNNNRVNPGTCIASNTHRTQAECDADNVEYLARDAANRAYLSDTFARARQGRAAGLVIVMQADPVFDLPETETIDERTTTPNVDGYNELLATLIAETENFSGQVMLVHGDTHFFKHDKPLIRQAELLPNFTRLETFGSPNVHWVKVVVDPSVRSLFLIEPMIVRGN